MDGDEEEGERELIFCGGEMKSVGELGEIELGTWELGEGERGWERKVGEEDGVFLEAEEVGDLKG